MVNKGLSKQVRINLAKTTMEETEEIALAACAAGVPISEIHIRRLPQRLTLRDSSIAGHVIYIGGLGIPVTVKLY